MDQSFCRVTRRYDPAEVAKYALANKFALAVRASSIASALGAFYVRRELIWKNLEDTAPDSPAGVGRCVHPPLPPDSHLPTNKPRRGCKGSPHPRW
jgi:hypothetical protein